MILPAKLVNERLMFLIDYGDKLPWGSVVTGAKIEVTVSSGEDPTPQRVFSQVWDIDGTIVTYQVRNGLPGVVYDLNTAVQVSGEWLYMTVKLAVLPDSGDVGALYPLTRVFTSLPYVQLMTDEISQSMEPTSGVLVQILYESDLQPDNVDLTMEPTGGDLLIPPPGETFSESEMDLIPTDGDLFTPPPANIDPNSAVADLALEPSTGILAIPPLGELQIDETDLAFIPTGGELSLAVTPVTWNPSDKSSLITLSSGDLVATRTGTTDAYGTVRATQARNAADPNGFYFEVVVSSSTSPYVLVGIATAAASLSAYVGSDAYGWGYYQEAGYKISNGVLVAYGATYTTGDVIGVLLKNGKLYFRKNGTWQNSANPDTETGEAYSGLTGNMYPAVSMYRSISPAHAFTARFKSSAFSGTLPLNVSAWES